VSEQGWRAAVRADMAEQQLSVTGVAEHMGLDRGTLSRWLEGHKRPSDAKLRVLALLLGKPEQHYIAMRNHEESEAA